MDHYRRLSDHQRKRDSWIFWLKICLTITLLGAAIAGIAYEQVLLGLAQAFLNWIETKPLYGFIGFVGVYAIASIIAFSGSALSLGAAAVFTRIFVSSTGNLVAVTAVFFGATIGALLSFLISRVLLRNLVQTWIRRFPSVHTFDQVIEQHGFQVVFLLRLCPLIPVNAFNYFMGISGVKFRSFSLACIGLIPHAVASISVGTSVTEILTASSIRTILGISVLTYLTVGSGLGLSAILLLIYCSRNHKKLTPHVELTSPQECKTFDPSNRTMTIENRIRSGAFI
jgi:uncharacterized membrane protein YdjX (TVP38/TMEM64 family)